jgi:RND family efflux transporter MFP subunit
MRLPENDPSSNQSPEAEPHSQAKPSPNKGSVRGLAIAIRIVPPLLILAIGWFGYVTLSIEPEETKRAKGKPRPIKTQVVELIAQNYETKIITQGNVRPHDQITLNSEVTGKVVRISANFEDGAFFNKGEILVELDTADFEAAVANAEAQVARNTSGYALEKAESDQARTNWEKLSPDLNEDPDPLVLRLPQLKQAEANVKSANAQLGRALRDLERARIRAPFDGRVRQRVVGLGQAIRTNSPLGTIFASDYAEVRLPISGEDLPLLDLPERVGDPPVEVVLRDTLNLANETVWKAQIIRTEGTLDARSLELFAIAKVDDPFGIKSGKSPLRIGQPVTASVSGKILQNVMALPRLGVKRINQIYIVDPKDLTLHNRTIEAVWADEHNVLIRDPQIPDGFLLATTKLSYAPEGATVEILPDLDPESLAKTSQRDPKAGKPEKSIGKGGGKKSGGI